MTLPFRRKKEFLFLFLKLPFQWAFVHLGWERGCFYLGKGRMNLFRCYPGWGRRLRLGDVWDPCGRAGRWCGWLTIAVCLGLSRLQHPALTLWSPGNTFLFWDNQKDWFLQKAEISCEWFCINGIPKWRDFSFSSGYFAMKLWVISLPQVEILKIVHYQSYSFWVSLNSSANSVGKQ